MYHVLVVNSWAKEFPSNPSIRRKISVADEVLLSYTVIQKG